MDKLLTLEKVIDDISRKDLDQARLRLGSLLQLFPDDLGVRDILKRMEGLEGLDGEKGNGHPGH